MVDLLIISSKAPYSTLAANDALDAALAASNVGLSVAMLFEQDGLYQLIGEHQVDKQLGQSIQKRITALPMFDIEQLYYFLDERLNNKHIKINQTHLNNMQSLSVAEKTTLLTHCKHILRF